MDSQSVLKHSFIDMSIRQEYLKYASENSYNSLAEIVSTAVVGVPPEIMGIGPVKSSIKALQRANLTFDDTYLAASRAIFGTTAATLSVAAGEFSTLSSINSSSAKYTTQYELFLRIFF